MTYAEERELTLRLALRCEFPESYEGDDDGYAWAASIPAVAAEIAAAAAAILRRRGWQVRPANRGRPADEEITLVAERVVER